MERLDRPLRHRLTQSCQAHVRSADRNNRYSAGGPRSRRAPPRYAATPLSRAAGATAAPKFERLPSRNRHAQAVAIAAPLAGQPRIARGSGAAERSCVFHPGGYRAISGQLAHRCLGHRRISRRSGARPSEGWRAATTRPPAQRHPRISPFAAGTSRFAGEGAGAMQRQAPPRRHEGGRHRRRELPALLPAAVAEPAPCGASWSGAVLAKRELPTGDRNRLPRPGQMFYICSQT